MTFKSPDAGYYAISDIANQNRIEIDEAEIVFNETAGAYTDGEYVTIEFDSETGDAHVCKQ